LSACQRHLAITFFRGTELPDPAELFSVGSENNKNIRGVRLKSREGINRGALEELVHAAVALDADVSVPPLPKVKRKPIPMPDHFAKALKKNAAAAAFFRSL